MIIFRHLTRTKFRFTPKRDFVYTPPIKRRAVRASLPVKSLLKQALEPLNEPLEAPKTPKIHAPRILNADNCEASKQIAVRAICLRVLALAQAIAEKKFYPYQVELTYRIVESLLLRDGAVLTSLMARQAGKSECLGAIAAAIAVILPTLARKFPDDWKLNITDEKGVYRGFNQGVKIGIYAPKQEQAANLFERVKKALNNETGKKVLSELKINFDERNGNSVRLSNGSRIFCESASEQSKIEGETHHLLLLEECLVGGSKVLLEDGTEKTIKEIVEKRLPLKVQTVINGELIFKDITSWSIKGERETISLELDNGEVLKCTPEHKIYTVEKGWIKAEDSLNSSLVVSDLSSYTGAYDDTTNEGFSNRDIIRRRINSLPRERFQECSLHLLSRLTPESVCSASMENSQAFIQSSTTDRREWRKRSFLISLHNQVSAYIHLLERAFLPSRNKDNSQRDTRLADTASDSLLVHGRRFFRAETLSSFFDSFFFPGRYKEAAICFFQKIWNRCHSVFDTIRKNLEYLCRECAGLLFADSALYAFSSFRLQDERSYFRGVCLPDMQIDFQSLSKERGESVLLARMSKEATCSTENGSRVESRESRLRPPKTCKVKKISRSTVENVYDIGVADSHCFFANGVLVHNCQEITDKKIRKSLHPMVAATNGTIVKIGTATTQKCDFYETIKFNERVVLVGGRRNHFFFPHSVVSQYNSFYKKHIESEKLRLGEESDEFQTSYEGRWIFERGMFVTQEQLFNIGVARASGEWSLLYNGSMPRQFKDYSLVAGIDWGSSNDSTVLALGAVDWAAPVDTAITYFDGEPIAYTFYRKHVIAWLEMIGDNYENQFGHVMQFFSQYPRLAKIVTDSNTCGKPIFDRLVGAFAGRNVMVEPFNFQPRVKSDGYKALYSDICGKRITFPASADARSEKSYSKFVHQMLDLRKEYKNGLMCVAHPEEKGAHDDYPDAFMMMNWGCNNQGFSAKVDFQQRNPFYN